MGTGILLDQVFEKDAIEYLKQSETERLKDGDGGVFFRPRFHRREKERECERKRNKCGEYSDREKEGKKRKRHPENHQKGTQKLFLPFPPHLFVLSFFFFCLSEVNERERTEVNERKEE